MAGDGGEARARIGLGRDQKRRSDERTRLHAAIAKEGGKAAVSAESTLDRGQKKERQPAEQHHQEHAQRNGGPRERLQPEQREERARRPTEKEVPLRHFFFGSDSGTLVCDALAGKEIGLFFGDRLKQAGKERSRAHGLQPCSGCEDERASHQRVIRSAGPRRTRYGRTASVTTMKTSCNG